MTQRKVAYICDRKKDCGRFEHCQIDCFHTTDTFHTKNGIIRVEKDLDTDSRFIKVGTVNEVTYYMEVLDGNNDGEN